MKDINGSLEKKASNDCGEVKKMDEVKK